MPIYGTYLIYDNGASIKNKEFKFCIDRVGYKLMELSIMMDIICFFIALLWHIYITMKN